MPFKKYLRTADELREAGFDPGRRWVGRETQPVIHIALLETALNHANLLSPNLQASLDFLHTTFSDQRAQIDKLTYAARTAAADRRLLEAGVQL